LRKDTRIFFTKGQTRTRSIIDKAILLLVISFLMLSAHAENNDSNAFQWQEVAPVPPGKNSEIQHGLAAPFAGYTNGRIIVAGGCNFPDKPVYDGGAKRYYDDVFVYDPEFNKWDCIGQYPHRVAYGASVSTTYGIACIGGNNNEDSFNEVYLLTWNEEDQQVMVTEWPELPYRMTNFGAALVDEVIYVAGGLADDQLANKFLSLDLSQINTSDFKWNELEDFPGPARIQPVAAGQNAAEESHFYLFSGSSFPENDSIPIISTDGLEYNPKTRQWSKVSDITIKNENTYSLHGASGIPIGTHHILFVGGVNKDKFREGLLLDRNYADALESGDSMQIGKLTRKKYEYFTRPPEWYKFNRSVLVYHTITDTWAKADNYPFTGPAGAPAVMVEDSWFVINGEIKPGVRTPRVVRGTMAGKPDFGWLNWVFLFAYLGGMLFLGYFFMQRENSTEDFFKGGQRIPWWAAGMSIFATMLSAITFMAIPAKTYATDWRYFMMAVTIFVVAFPVVKYYLPFFRRLNVTTAYEYLEQRFNTTTRLLASAIFIVFMIARTALVLFLPSLALTTVTGIDIFICIILMGVITIIYCTMGGVEAVIWGDVIQGFVLLGGALLAVVFLVSGTEGGISRVIDITIEHEKMKTFDFTLSFTSATFWVVLLGGLANNLISYSSDQTVIQRYLTTRDERTAGKSIYLNGLLSILVSFVFYFIGTGLYAFYKTNPDQLNIAMENPDSIFPHFIMTKMPIGIAGILIAAIFAATMSTVSSSINSLSTAFTTDFYRKFSNTKEDKHYLFVARISGIIMGGLGVGLALLMAMWNILSLFDYFNYILGLLASGLGGLFLMGIFIPRIKSRAAIIGFLGGFLTVLSIRLLTDIHLMLFGFIGMVSSVIYGLLASYFISEKEKSLQGLTINSISKKT
jgi:SSS family solute:Na+ symporter